MHYSQHPVHRGVFVTATKDKVYLYSVSDIDVTNRENTTNHRFGRNTRRSKLYAYDKCKRNDSENHSATDSFSSNEQNYSNVKDNTTSALRLLQPISEIVANCQGLREGSFFNEHTFTECAPTNKPNLLPHTLSIFPSNTACIDDLTFFIADDANNGWMGNWNNNVMSKMILERNYHNKKSIKNREELQEVHHTQEKKSSPEEERQKQKKEIASLTSKVTCTSHNCNTENARITCSSWCNEHNTPLLAIGRKNGVVQVYQVEPIANYSRYRKVIYGFNHRNHHLHNYHRNNGLSHSSMMHSRTSEYIEPNYNDTSSSDSEESNSDSSSTSDSDSNKSSRSSKNGNEKKCNELTNGMWNSQGASTHDLSLQRRHIYQSNQLTHSLHNSHNTNTKIPEYALRKERMSHSSRDARQRIRSLYKSCLIWEKQCNGPVKSILWLPHRRLVIVCSTILLTNNERKEIAEPTAPFGDYVEINDIPHVNKNNIGNSSFNGSDLTSDDDNDNFNHVSICFGAPLSLIMHKMQEVNNVSYSLYRNSTAPSIDRNVYNDSSSSNHNNNTHKSRTSKKSRSTKTKLNNDAINANELLQPHELFIRHSLFMCYNPKEENNIGSNVEMENRIIYSLCFADVIAVHDRHDYFATSSCVNLSEYTQRHPENKYAAYDSSRSSNLFMNIVQLWDLRTPNCPVVQKFCIMPFADKYTSLQWISSLPSHHQHHRSSGSSSITNSFSSLPSSSSYESISSSSYLHGSKQDKHYSQSENEELLLLGVTSSGKMHIHSFHKRSMSCVKALNKYYDKQHTKLYEYQHFNRNNKDVEINMPYTEKGNELLHEEQLEIQHLHTSEEENETVMNEVHDWDVATRYLQLPSFLTCSTAFYIPALKCTASSNSNSESNYENINGSCSVAISDNTQMPQLIVLNQNSNTVHALPFHIQPFPYKHIMTFLSRHNVMICGNQHVISSLDSEMLQYQNRNTCNGMSSVAARRRACMLERAECHFGLNVQQNIKLLITTHHNHTWRDHEAACLFNYGRVMSHYLFPELHGQCSPLLSHVPSMMELIAREVKLRNAASWSIVPLNDKAILAATHKNQNKNSENNKMQNNKMQDANPVRNLLLKSMKWEVEIEVHENAKDRERTESVCSKSDTDDANDKVNNKVNSGNAHNMVSINENKSEENVVSRESYNKQQITWWLEHEQKVERRMCILVCQHYLERAIDLLLQYRQANELFVLFAMALQMHCKTCKECFVTSNVQAYEELLNDLTRRCLHKENTHWMQLTLHILRLQLDYYKTHSVYEQEEQQEFGDNNNESTNYNHDDEWLESLELPLLLKHHASWMNMADKIGLAVCLTLPESYHTHQLNKLFKVLEAMANDEYRIATSFETRSEMLSVNTTNQSMESCTLTSGHGSTTLEQSTSTSQMEWSSSSSVSLLLAATVELRDEEIMEIDTCSNRICTTNISALQEYVDETGEMQCPLMYELCYGNCASAQIQNWSEAYLRLLDENALYMVRCAFELNRLQMWERRKESQERSTCNCNIETGNADYNGNMCADECNTWRNSQFNITYNNSENNMRYLQTHCSKCIYNKEEQQEHYVNEELTNGNSKQETVNQNNNNNNKKKKKKNSSKHAQDEKETIATGRNVDTDIIRKRKVVSLLHKYNHSTTEPSLNRSSPFAFSNPCSPSSSRLHDMFSSYNAAHHLSNLHSNTNMISNNNNNNNFTMGGSVSLKPITSPTSPYGGPRSMKYPLPFSLPHRTTTITSHSIYSHPPSFSPLGVDKLNSQELINARITETCSTLLDQYKKLPLELRCECRQAMHNSAPSIAALQYKRFNFNLYPANSYSQHSQYSQYSHQQMQHHHHHHHHCQQPQQMYPYYPHPPQGNAAPFSNSGMPRPSFSSILQQPCSNPECQSKNGPQCVICEERFKRKPTAAGDALDYSFAWCTRCLHGGHYIHLVEWFAKHKKCAVEFCECECCLK